MRFYNICIFLPSKYSLIYHQCKCERTLLWLTQVAARSQNVKHVKLTLLAWLNAVWALSYLEKSIESRQNKEFHVNINKTD